MEFQGAKLLPTDNANPPSSPDWDGIKEEITCPLCEYNLRGLTEPRCPECGYQFEWQKLIDQRSSEHPWLFEHRRRRKIRALFHTFLASQLPWSFWRSVQPIHRPKLARLILYWFGLTSILCGVVLQYQCRNLIKYYVTLPYVRHQLRVDMEEEIEGDKRPSNRAWRYDYYTEDMVAEYGSVAAVARLQKPLILPWDQYVREFEPRTLFENIGYHTAIGCALWPWLTWLSLLLFQQTIRKAKIGKVHLLRCAVYSSDLCLLLALPVAWLLSLTPIVISRSGFFPLADLLIPAGLAAVLAIKLSHAWRTYLGFPHPIAVAAASQIIVLLSLLAVAPWYWIR